MKKQIKEDSIKKILRKYGLPEETPGLFSFPIVSPTSTERRVIAYQAQQRVAYQEFLERQELERQAFLANQNRKKSAFYQGLAAELEAEEDVLDRQRIRLAQERRALESCQEQDSAYSPFDYIISDQPILRSSKVSLMESSKFEFMEINRELLRR